MKERPILFQGEMVRAILTGQKTQTRRIIKPQPDEFSTLGWTEGDRAAIFMPRKNGKWIRCPYGEPGDWLWVRETWTDITGNYADRKKVAYKATEKFPHEFKWKPSIHQPRAYSRIDLQVFKRYPERLQDISEADAVAEGVTALQAPTIPGTAKAAYALLWDHINGVGAWKKNPYVWVVKFNRFLPDGHP